MNYRWPDKDPDARKDYAFDWSAFLKDGETIITSTWTVDKPELVVDVSSILDDGVTLVWLSGGTVGVTYKITNHIVTSRGLIDDRTAYLVIAEQ